MLRVALDLGAPVVAGAREHAAADPAIGAGGARPALAHHDAFPSAGRSASAERSMRMRPSSTRSGKVARAAFVRALRLARLEAQDPVVQRAGDALAVHDALAQRAPLMRAAVLEREGLIVGGAEDGDATLGHAHDARPAARDLVERADVGPDGRSVIGLTPRRGRGRRSARIRARPCRRRARSTDRSGRRFARTRTGRRARGACRGRRRPAP